MNVEAFVEKTLFASRWLLCPLYIGLAFLLLLFSIHFFRELIDLAIRAFSVTETDLVVEALTLIDLALAGGLVVMIMLSGYENYVSKLDIADADVDPPAARNTRWLLIFLGIAIAILVFVSLARKPGEPNPYVIGKEEVMRYLTVVDECAQAGLARVTQ